MDLIEDGGGTHPPRRQTRSDSIGTTATTMSTPIPPCPSASPLSSQGDHVTPKLGDFAKLRLAIRPISRETTPGRPQPRDTIGTTDRQRLSPTSSRRSEITADIQKAGETPLTTLKLGDFGRIFQQLGTPEPPRSGFGDSVTSTHRFLNQRLPVDIPGANPEKATSHWKAENAARVRGDLSDSDGSASAGFETDPRFATDPVTPPTSWDDVLSPSDGQLQDKPVDATEDGDADMDIATRMYRAKLALKQAQARDRQLEPKLNDWLCDWYTTKAGPRYAIKEDLLTREAAHQLLCRNLIPVTTHDALLAEQFPDTADNGVHVFVDYSNINISFQQFLKDYYDLPDNARLFPTPNIGLSFLHELLLRGRHAHTLFAGGSIGRKDKHEPAFVQELRELGYTVDLRERVRAEDPSFRGLKRSSARTSDNEHSQPPLQSPGHLHHNYGTPSKEKSKYKEEFVDESLQSRIASTTLDFLDTPGTLIFVTGDGKPAPYADGFVRYAERALKRGYHVEVVSWKKSLSREWENLRAWQEDATGSGACRFRVIELDAFWRELVPAFAD